MQNKIICDHFILIIKLQKNPGTTVHIFSLQSRVHREKNLGVANVSKTTAPEILDHYTSKRQRTFRRKLKIKLLVFFFLLQYQFFPYIKNEKELLGLILRPFFFSL